MSERLIQYARYFRHLNAGVILLFAVSCLTLLGLIVLSSATQSFASGAFFFQKQVIWLIIALGAGTAASLVDLEKARRFVPLVALATVVGLALVLIPGIGVEVNGARRWIDLGFMRVQVSEFAKLGMIFVLAHYMAENQRELHTFLRGFCVPVVCVGIVAGLVFVEPDFGTAALCGAVGYLLMFLAGVRFSYLFGSGLVALTGFSVAVIHDPVRLARITSFLDVEGNKSTGAYQLWQGILAFGAGGVEGVGLGNGRQQMSFLPEAHTDFIFPIIGEEMGIFFTVGVVLLFLMIMAAGFWNLRKAPNLYHFTLVAGALLFILLQALINMGVVTGMLPTKGMSLPFISYGGSNLVLMFVFVGLIINCFRNWAESPLKRPREL